MTEPLVLELSDKWMPADPGLASKFRFYISLNEKERNALDLLLMMIRLNRNELFEVEIKSGLKGIELDALIEKSVRKGILKSDRYSVDADAEFLIFVYPFIKDRILYFGRSLNNYYHDTTQVEDAVAFVSIVLSRAGGCDPDPAAEKNEYNYDGEFGSLIWKIVGYRHYREILPYFNREKLSKACFYEIAKLMGRCEDLTGLSDAYSEFSEIDIYRKAAMGDFDGLMATGTNESDRAFAAASSIFLKEDDPGSAMEFFDKGLKVLRRKWKKCQMPDGPLWMIYYLCFVLTKLPAEYAPILEKINEWTREGYGTSEMLIRGVCAVHLDQTGRTNPDKVLLNSDKYNDPTLALGAACMYLAGSEPNRTLVDKMAERAEIMISNGYSAMAAEMLCAVSSWSKDAAHLELYRKTKERLGF